MPLGPKNLKPGTVSPLPNSGSVHVGESATRRFQVITVMAGLKMEMMGIRVRRGASCLAVAKRLTGSRTNNRAKQLELLQQLREELEKNVTIDPPLTLESSVGDMVRAYVDFKYKRTKE